VKEESALFFERAARSGDTVGFSARPCRRNLGVSIRLARNQGGVHGPGRTSARVSVNNPHSPWPRSGGATDKTNGTVGQAGSPK
jgi:hypothetical protein